jgi:hypothetical protein
MPMNHVADKIPAEAWKALTEASDERDIPDFKDALQVLVKACPELTYPKLEKEFRDRGFAVYLIALVRPTGPLWMENVLTQLQFRRRTTARLLPLSTYKARSERNTLCRTS